MSDENKGLVLSEINIETFIIAEENHRMSNPFLGGISNVNVHIMDDHKSHIKAHIKRLYNPFSWFHIITHMIMMRKKNRMGIAYNNNDIFNAVFNKALAEDPITDSSSVSKTWH